MSLTRTFLSARTLRTPVSIRTFTTTPLRRSDPPPSENSPSGKAAGRTTHQSEDKQSSASQAEHLSGDDHPAKQPDNQQESESSTGFHEVKGGVKGGKEGLGARDDKPGKPN
ncbi:hypothetical protein H2203_002136 [Taxawa tesnikishii (nom. ined.)]|nr:hypothetical protein H2203_002136 [Dothideales sp. JES 119]